MQFRYDRLLETPEVYHFVKNKAMSVGSCEGYFIPSLLTTTTFVLASNQATMKTLTHNQPLNIFTIFVGYPGTGNYKFFEFTVYLQQAPVSIFESKNQLQSRFSNSTLC